MDDATALFSFRQTPLGAGEVAWLQEQIDGGSQLSHVAAAACRRFDWVRPSGEIPLAACSVMLRKLVSSALTGA